MGVLGCSDDYCSNYRVEMQRKRGYEQKSRWIFHIGLCVFRKTSTLQIIGWEAMEKGYGNVC